MIALTVAGLAVVGAAAGAWWFARAAVEPHQARVENGLLRAFDSRNRLLWERAFTPPLADTDAARAARRESASTLVEDVDGDGQKEVLFINNVEELTAEASLYCFESDGRLRFRHTPHYHVTYGSIPTTGPWRPLLVTVVRGDDGRGSIWFASNDTSQFPTVVEKLDGHGNVVGRFWHPGIVSQIRRWNYGGRPAVLVAASNNDFDGTSLAVLDLADPTGTAPAAREHYTCHGCPDRPPLAFVVLPGTDVERLQDGQGKVSNVWMTDQGELIVETWRTGGAFAQAGEWSGAINYRLDATLRPIAAEHQPGFVVLHNELTRRGHLDHLFGRRDIDGLWPIYAWNGRAFQEARPTAR